MQKMFAAATEFLFTLITSVEENRKKYLQSIAFHWLYSHLFELDTERGCCCEESLTTGESTCQGDPLGCKLELVARMTQNVIALAKLM